LALVPENGSVPAWTLSRYWLVDKPWFDSRYVKKSFRLPEKLEMLAPLVTKLYTVMAPFLPLYSFQLWPATVGVATGEPVLEIGPAPPRAASQTMISYSALPPEVEEVNMS